MPAAKNATVPQKVNLNKVEQNSSATAQVMAEKQRLSSVGENQGAVGTR
jgi:hypothetical protein